MLAALRAAMPFHATVLPWTDKLHGQQLQITGGWILTALTSPFLLSETTAAFCSETGFTCDLRLRWGPQDGILASRV